MEQSIKEISTRIFDGVVFDVIHKDGSLYNRLMKKVADIDVDYFEDIERDGEVLAAGLNMALKDRVVKDFEELSDECLSLEVEQGVLANVQRLVGEWNAECEGAMVAKGIEAAKHEIYKYSEERLRVLPAPKYTLSELDCMYKDARQRTMPERILRTNKKDVIEFHHALMDRTVWECGVLVEQRIADMLRRIADNL